MKKLLILSGKGGTGKTTIASNFIKISEARVFADCDVEAPNLHLVSQLNIPSKTEDYYGLDKYIIDQDVCINCNLCKENCRFNAIEIKDGNYYINKFLCEGCGVCEMICPVNAISPVKSKDGEISLFSNKRVFATAELKMGSGNSGLLVTKVKKQLETEIKEKDLVIIDGPPGIGCPVIASMSGVDLILLVAEPSMSGILDLKRIIKTAYSFKIPIAVGVNKYDLNLELTDEIINYVNENSYNYVGRIRYDRAIIDAINHGKNLAESTLSFQEIYKVYQETMKVLGVSI